MANEKEPFQRTPLGVVVGGLAAGRLKPEGAELAAVIEQFRREDRTVADELPVADGLLARRWNSSPGCSSVLKSTSPAKISASATLQIRLLARAFHRRKERRRGRVEVTRHLGDCRSHVVRDTSAANSASHRRPAQSAAGSVRRSRIEAARQPGIGSFEPPRLPLSNTPRVEDTFQRGQHALDVLAWDPLGPQQGAEVLSAPDRTGNDLGIWGQIDAGARECRRGLRRLAASAADSEECNGPGDESRRHRGTVYRAGTRAIVVSPQELARRLRYGATRGRARELLKRDANLFLESHRPSIELRRLIAPVLRGVEHLPIVEAHHALDDRCPLDGAALRDGDLDSSRPRQRDPPLIQCGISCRIVTGGVTVESVASNTRS